MNWKHIVDNWREILLSGGLLVGAVLAGILLHLLFALIAYELEAAPDGSDASEQ